MDPIAIELGITDYLHEIELWRQRLKRWELRLPWPEGAGAALCVEKLMQFGDDAALVCRAIRQLQGFDEGLDERHLMPQEIDELETELGLAIWQIMREEARLRAIVPQDAPPVPYGLPRARLRVRR
jgi:hypothetical protein